MAELPKELDPRVLSKLSTEEQRKILNLPQAVDNIASHLMNYFIESHPEFLSAIREAGETPEDFEADIRWGVEEALRKSGIPIDEKGGR